MCVCARVRVHGCACVLVARGGGRVEMHNGCAHVRAWGCACMLVYVAGGDTVLIYGEDGYAHLLSASNADDESTDVRLEKETDKGLNDATWHPGGKSALIVGGRHVAYGDGVYKSENGITGKMWSKL